MNNHLEMSQCGRPCLPTKRRETCPGRIAQHVSSCQNAGGLRPAWNAVASRGRAKGFISRLSVPPVGGNLRRLAAPIHAGRNCSAALLRRLASLGRRNLRIPPAVAARAHSSVG